MYTYSTYLLHKNTIMDPDETMKRASVQECNSATYFEVIAAAEYDKWTLLNANTQIHA
jgi:hypothetical protein